MSELKKKFLIRSSGKILGPFDKKEVIDLIKKKEVSSSDEIAEPYGIWFYLEDHTGFNNFFQNQLTNFVTKITNSFSTSQTTSVTGADQTNTDTDVNRKEDLTSMDKQSALEVEVESVDKPQEKEKNKGVYKSQTDHDEFVKRRVGKAIRYFWIFIIVFSISILAYISYKQVFLPFQKKKEVLYKLDTEGLKFYKAGFYEKALLYYEQAYRQKLLKPKDLFALGAIYIQEGKLQKASLILEDGFKSSQLKNKDGFLLKGLLSFMREDFFQAESFFQKVETSLDGKLNLSILHWVNNRYTDSLFYIDQAINQLYERDLVFYIKTLNFFSQGESQRLIDYIEKEIFLNTNSSLTIEFRQEMSFMLAYSYWKQGNQEDFLKSLEFFFDEDPFLSTKDYQYSPFLAINQLNWSYFIPYCENLFQSDSKSDLLNMLLGFCYLKAGKLKKGSDYIDYARRGQAHRPFYLSLYAYSLILKAEFLEAEQSLSLIEDNTKKQKKLFPYIIKAYYLIQTGQWHKALKAWEEVLSLSPEHLSAMAGIAISSYRSGQSVKGDIYKKRVLDKYPYFVRLLSYE